jgi:hypothetical protein
MRSINKELWWGGEKSVKAGRVKYFVVLDSMLVRRVLYFGVVSSAVQKLLRAVSTVFSTIDLSSSSCFMSM